MRFDKRDVIILRRRDVAVSVAAADVGDELTIFDDWVIFYSNVFHLIYPEACCLNPEQLHLYIRQGC